MTSPNFRGITRAGRSCQARPVTGTEFCVAHTADPVIRGRAREGAQRGGRSRALQLRPASAPAFNVSDLDLETAAGIRTYLARALEQLACLPFDVRVANAMGQLANVTKAIIEVTSIEERLTALEGEYPFHVS